LQDYLDLSLWRQVDDGEHVWGTHLTVVHNPDGSTHTFLSTDPKASFTYHSEHWIADEESLGHEVYVPRLPDTRPGAVLEFDTEAGGGYAVAQNDGRWSLVHFSGRPALAGITTEQLLRQFPSEFRLALGGRDREETSA
jgi:hypothetical protein